MTYDFKCSHCGHVQEEFMRMDDRDDPVVCNKCGEMTTRQISPVTHHIKYYKRLYGQRIDDAKLMKGTDNE